MVTTQPKQIHTCLKLKGRRVILVQHCQESGSSNQLLAPSWSSSASKPKLGSGRKLQCILQACQHPLQHCEDFIFMSAPTRPQDMETIDISIHGIHRISNHYKEENWYCADFIVGCFPGYSRKREERQGKQPSGYGDWGNMPTLGQVMKATTSAASQHTTGAMFPPCQFTDRGKMFSLLHCLLSASSQWSIRDARLAEELGDVSWGGEEQEE